MTEVVGAVLALVAVVAIAWLIKTVLKVAVRLVLVVAVLAGVAMAAGLLDRAAAMAALDRMGAWAISTLETATEWVTGTAGVALVFLAGCSATAGGIAERSDALDPVGGYEITMASASMVSEGTMEIVGTREGWGGELVLGSVRGPVAEVDAGPDHMTVHAAANGRPLVLRLVWDGEVFSGNWIMGNQRGTVSARKVDS